MMPPDCSEPRAVPPERPSRPGPRPPLGPQGRPAPTAAGRQAAGGRPGAPAPLARGGQAGQANDPDGPTSELKPQLDELEAQIERLKVEYQRHLAGDPSMATPPEDLLRKIDERLRRLRSFNIQRSVDHFRLGALEGRFNSYREMFHRRLRNVEEGRVAPRRPVAPAERPRFDVESGVMLDARAEREAVEALFQGLCQRSPRGTTMDLDTFRSYLEKQVASIREKTGCATVQFRLLTEEGKVKIKARPMGASGAGGP
jgi:hypothetical protein